MSPAPECRVAACHHTPGMLCFPAQSLARCTHDDYQRVAIPIVGPATAAVKLARRARASCCQAPPAVASAQLLLPRRASRNSSTSRSGNNADSNGGGATARRWEPCINGRHRWSGQPATAAAAAATGGVSTPRGASPLTVAAGGAGATAAAAREQRTRKAGLSRELSSSFLADAVRETATNHCIDRVVNGSLDGAVAVVSGQLYHCSLRFQVLIRLTASFEFPVGVRKQSTVGESVCVAVCLDAGERQQDSEGQLSDTQQRIATGSKRYSCGCMLSDSRGTCNRFIRKRQSSSGKIDTSTVPCMGFVLYLHHRSLSLRVLSTP